MKKRIICLLLSLICACSLVCCNKAESSLSDLSVYKNDDYHFEFTYPSAFSLKETVESEENSNECDFVFKDGSDRKITILCRLNPHDDIYAYVKESGLNEKKITALTYASFIYDMKNEDNPFYQIISATKRMVITVDFRFDKQDTSAQQICENLSFVFTEYANVPRENRFLSDDVSINASHLSVNIPANAEYTLYPEPATLPDGEQNEDEFDANADCTDLDIYSNYYASSYRMINKALSPYASSGLTSQGANSVDAEHVYALSDERLDNITFLQGKMLDGPFGAYIYAPFTCEYNGKASYGAYIAGFFEDLYYEYAYSCNNDAPDGEREQFESLLASLEID